MKQIKLQLNEELEKSPQESQKYEYLLGIPSWIEKIKKKYVDPLLLPKDFNQKSRIKKATSEIWKKFKNLRNYKSDKDYKNLVVYLLWKYSNLSQAEIAHKLHISNSNAVGQRIYKIRKRLQKKGKLKKLLDKIEK